MQHFSNYSYDMLCIHYRQSFMNFVCFLSPSHSLSLILCQFSFPSTFTLFTLRSLSAFTQRFEAFNHKQLQIKFIESQHTTYTMHLICVFIVYVMYIMNCPLCIWGRKYTSILFNKAK